MALPHKWNELGPFLCEKFILSTWGTWAFLGDETFVLPPYTPTKLLKWLEWREGDGGA